MPQPGRYRIRSGFVTVETKPIPEDEPRPRSLDPQELGFIPRGPVPWLSPGQLAVTALRVVLSTWFGAYLDKRELQHALPDEVFDEGADQGEAWFDYVADLGDGFHPTYTVAYLLAQPELRVEGAPPLPRGRMLMMGGDEVYPTPSKQQYEDRTKGPYQAAMPQPPLDGPQPSLYALPGNHDWYDGLTAFIRLFAKDGKDRLGGWRNAQARSYFAIQLPHRWWLFAVDTQFGAYIDEPQLTYFRQAAQQLRPGDTVIVCPPTPGWVEAENDPGAYNAIDFFARTVIEPTGAEIRLMLSGDLHHYAHYTGPDRHLVTCGGGGAYLYGTHELPERIQVPPPQSLSRKPTRCKDYDLTGRYPETAASKRFATGVFFRLPWRNPSFAALLGVVHALFMLGVLDIIAHPEGVQQHLVTVPVALVGAIILGGATAFAMPERGDKKVKHWLFGLGHGTVHIGLGILGAHVWAHLPFVHYSWPWPLLATAVLYVPVSGLVAAEVVSLYLLIAGSAKVNLNELYAAQSIVDGKIFLRCHIGTDGALTIYPLAVDRVCRQWTVRPTDPVDQPWLQPTAPIGVRLAEPPIRIAKEPRP
jgi:hypothetical protein